ncbi:THUMP domain-containing class I SAM-dependent RNA methyltransferase [Penaeicola halotolerans]|uniref:THUMP domain-containing class I SAM-dependent RNA methyltransferase n=1 Tax=Penaeicola halotolerans TaxID=2793196 RepID=UPI001CF8C0DE|nr:class I SAM-dependent RNA methyltransferase [Penaeicola halotolerans]
MKVFEKAAKIIITCNRWLAPSLEQEVLALGFTPTRVFPTGVELSGTVTDCIKLNLNLRCASQVLYSIKTLRLNGPEDLYKDLKKISWEQLIAEDGYFSVTSNVNHPSINNELFVNVKVKDAIADYFRDKTGSRPDSGSELLGAVIHLYWKDDFAELFLDTSGETLAKHGYRKIPGKAPMLEALAAATVMASGWDMKSPFINPMCGSGTLAIEAAMLASIRVPGLYRSNYAFMHLIGYDEEIFYKEKERIRKQINEENCPVIIASDIDPLAVENAEKNALVAGVDHLITFEVCDFSETQIPEGQAGILFMNPEYGERLGETEELEITYKAIGDFMKQKCAGYTGAIFTGNLDLAKKIGLKASRRIEFFNGTIDCRLLKYELYAGTKRTDIG